MHIAGINQGAPAPIVPIRPFDPAIWLARYVELGGGHTVNSAGVCLHWSLRITEQEREALALHERPLRRNLVLREAVKDYLASLVAAEGEPC